MTQGLILDLSVSRRSSRSSQKIVTYLLRTLKKVLKQHRLQDGDIGKEATGISATEVVNNLDPRSTSTKTTKARL
jgi:hypothetical protein